MGAASNANRKYDEFVVFLTPSQNALNPMLETYMNILTAAPVAPLLSRLFEEADAAEPETDAAIADLSDEERALLIAARPTTASFTGG